MTEIQQKRLKFLEDTVKYYSEDINRRCINNKGCYYSPKSISKENISKGCAIGRHLTDKLKEELDENFENETVSKQQVFNLLPAELRELSKVFLRYVQRLHDTEIYWDSLGLTDLGEQYVGSIKERNIGGAFDID